MWSRNDGIACVPPGTQVRMATRPLGSQKPPPPSPLRQRESEVQRTPANPGESRLGSLVNNSNAKPTSAPATSQRDETILQRWAHDQQSWERREKELLEQNEAHVRKNGELHDEINNLKDQRIRDKQKTLSEERARADKERQAQLVELGRLEDRIKSLMKEASKFDRQRTNLERNLSKAERTNKQHEEYIQNLDIQYANDLAVERRAHEIQRMAELEAVKKGRQARQENERSSYEAYRKVYDAGMAAVSRFRNTVEKVEIGQSSASSAARNQQSYTALMEKSDPWFKHKYPELLSQLDGLVVGLRNKAEQSGKNIKEMRMKQGPALIEFKLSAHVSRALTRYHRMDASPNQMKTTEFFYWAANEIPFRFRRDELTSEIDHLEKQYPNASDRSTEVSEEIRLKEQERTTTNKVISVHKAFRDTERLKVLLSDRLEEKEVSSADSFPISQVTDANNRFARVTGDNSKAAGDSESSRGEKISVRGSFVDMRTVVNKQVTELQALVRRRSLLQQALGKVSSGRESALDAEIKYKLELSKRIGHAALADLAMSRKSSFAHPSASLGRSRVTRKSVSKSPVQKAAPSKDEIDKIYGSKSADLQRKMELEREIESEKDSKEKAAKERELKEHCARILEKQSALRTYKRVRTREAKRALSSTGKEVKDESAGAGSARKVALRLRRANRRKGEASSNAGSAKESQSEGSQSTSASLNMQPTAAKQAPHTSCAHDFRQFYGVDNAHSDSASNAVQAHHREDLDFYRFSNSAAPVGPPAETSVTVDSTMSSPTPPRSTDADLETPTRYQIPFADYRNAVMASRNSNAAFWSHKLYKNQEGKGPTIHFCTSLKQAEEQAHKFLNEPVLGFDIEWEPFKKTSIKDNVSLIQIAAEDKIAIFHLARFPGESTEQLIPPSLRSILESETTIKSGVNVAGDARRILNHLGIEMKGLFELSHLYKIVHYSATQPYKVNKRMINLAAQVQQVLLLPLKKDDVRTSAWAKPLGMQQVEYSASDAYAGFRLFHALEAKRRKMDPVPPRPALYEKQAPLVLGDGSVVRGKSAVSASSKKEAVDVDEEAADEVFYDAVESQDSGHVDVDVVAGVPLAGLRITYPTLPPLEDALVEGNMPKNAGQDGSVPSPKPRTSESSTSTSTSSLVSSSSIPEADK
ncbi:ribonuclease H-like protein [Hortaea werneckii]|uniref:3'-5' exonuclease domain-containing protein n=2 Tax=Hortaea werneckii TaxID=91943 RepID=A0A3M7GUH6_HORWE|nr:ribonuclease H-like protein [Hortaea werneckii]KAI6926170.1 ribonuclease H-like protein [Hortaea werneckii]KAI6947413.1 ribonuclease H-like protein [Hortaea werneckii]KAI6979405.1 ribonuclease H-like protein [Hortaea werneckii]KAI6989407.1 ribonuclease H-like protein [Hortaea werneckii]